MTPESVVKRAVLDYLAAEHILAFRMQSGVSFAKHRDKMRAIPYGVPGMADVLAFPRRRVERGLDASAMLGRTRITPVWIECKAEGGRQSEKQRSFQSQVEFEGHAYFVVRSVEDLKTALEAFA